MTSENLRVAPLGVRRLLIVASAGGAAAVAGMAFAMSFDALTALAQGAGIREAIAWMWPIVVDGSMIVATAAALVLRTSPDKAVRVYPWAQLALFALVSVIGNGLHASATSSTAPHLPGPVAVAVSGVPPIALLLSTHLLVMMLPRWRWTADADDPAAAPEPEPVHVTRLAQAPAGSARPMLDRPRPVTPVDLNRSTEPEPTAQPAPVTREPAQTDASSPEPSHEPRADEPAPVTPTATAADGDPTRELAAWIAEREAQGETVSGQTVADHLGVSLSTGKRRLRAARDELAQPT